MDANKRELKQQEAVEAMLFREIEKRGLMVNCTRGGVIEVRDGTGQRYSGGSLLKVMMEVVK